MIRKRVLVITVLLLLIAATPVWAAGRRLEDRELDQVTAGDYTLEFLDGAVRLQFDSSAGPNKSVSGEGDMTFTAAPQGGFNARHHSYPGCPAEPAFPGEYQRREFKHKRTAESGH